MSTLVKTGETATAANTSAKKAGTKKSATPKLICILTGRARFTNKEYLANKAATVGSMKRFLEHYVCQDAIVMLREGKTPAEVRKALKVDEKAVPMPSEEKMKIALEINGKRAKKAKKPAAAKASTSTKAKSSTKTEAKPAAKPAAAPETKAHEPAASTPATAS